MTTRLLKIVPAVFLVLAISSVFIPSSYALSVVNDVITVDPRYNTGCATPESKTSFSTTDDRVYYWVLVSNAMPPFDSLTFNWYAPDNSLYGSYTWAIGLAGSVCGVSWVDIAGQQASGKTGNWRAEIHLGGALAASKTFTIGSPPSVCTYTFSDWGACQPNGTQERTIISAGPAGCIEWLPELTRGCIYAQSPVVTYTPVSGSSVSGHDPFDFSFVIDFGQTLNVTAFSFSYNDIDVTQLLVDAYNAGYVKVSFAGNVVTFVLPDIVLASGQHKITVKTGTPDGTTTADWTMTVTPPRYALSDDQKALIAQYGNPDYLTIVFNSGNQRREETWAYTKAKKMYTFWDGGRVSEDPITVDPALYSKPPAFDPSLFTKDTTLQDLAQVVGGGYVEIDQSGLSSILGPIQSRTYYFSSKGLFVTFMDNRLVVLKTTDIPKGQ